MQPKKIRTSEKGSGGASEPEPQRVLSWQAKNRPLPALAGGAGLVYAALLDGSVRHPAQ
jgi:hypothetical protein